MKNKHRISIIMTGILACVGVSLFVFWQTQGPRIISAVNDAILVKASQDLNGRLAAERLEYSLFGETTAHKLVVYDNKSNVVASVDKMIIDFGVADLLRGTLATEKIKRVTVEGARIVLNYDSQGNWNVKNLLKPTSDEELQRFRGELKVNNASVSISGPEGMKQFEQIEGTLNFAAYPECTTELTGKLGNSNVAIEGRWSTTGALNVKAQADRLETRQFLAYFPAAEKTLSQDGNIYDLTLVLSREKGPVKIAANGVVSGLSADFSGAKFTAMAGKVKFSGNVLKLEDVTLLFGGQNLSANGEIDLNAEKTGIDLAVKGNSFELAALSDNTAVAGVASFQAVLKGSPGNLEINGNFSIPAGKYSSIAFTDATGDFTYANNTLSLKAVTLSSLGGKLALSGAWSPNNALFEQEITGEKLDAAALSDRKILGTVDFSARLTGKSASEAKIAGVFTMPVAVINETTLENIAGNFSKIGQSLELANLNFSTAGQNMTAAGKILLDGEDPELDLRLHSDGIEIAAIKPDSPISGQLAFQAEVAGTVKNHTIKGSLQIPSGQFGSLPFCDVDGDFHLADNVLKFRSLQFSLFDAAEEKQKLTASGRIQLAGSDSKLELNISSEGTDVKAFKPEFPLKGKVAFHALIAGTVKEPAVTGSFQIPSGELGALPFSDGNGEFIFAADVLNLRAVQFSALGGFIRTEGTIAKTGVYQQQVSGQNIDASVLTAGDVRGRAGFTANIHGEGAGEKSLAEGKITMASGAMKNIAFSSLHLDFRKRGTQIEIPTLDIKFLGGLVVGTGYTEGDYLLMKILPAKTGNSRLVGIGSLLLFGANPLVAIFGQALREVVPLGIMKIRINGLGSD